MPLKVSPSATLSRAVFQGSSASSWNSMPISDGAKPASTMPTSGFCSPMMARSMLDLPEPEGPTRLTNWPVPTSMVAPSRIGSPPYEMVRSRTRNSASDDRGVVQPGHARAGLDEAGGDQALLHALGRFEVDVHRFGIERVAVTRDDLAELLEIEAGGHLLGESRD